MMRIHILLVCVLVFVTPTAVADKPPEGDVFQFWLHSAYSDSITVNKAAPVFDPLGDQLGMKVVYRGASREQQIIKHINHDRVDLIVWGSSHEFNQKLESAGFISLTHSNLEVGLYRKKGGKSRDDLDIKTIGGLMLSASLDVAKRYYSDNGVEIVVRDFSNYYKALSALASGEIDYVVATTVLLQPMDPSISRKYEKIFSFPESAKIVVYSERSVQKTRKGEIIVKYFHENSSSINEVFGTGIFLPNSQSPLNDSSNATP